MYMCMKVIVNVHDCDSKNRVYGINDITFYNIF